MSLQRCLHFSKRGNYYHRNRQKQVAFENCATFTKYITKIDGKTIDDAEELDLVMPVYNLIEYSSKYSETTGSVWLYSKDEANNFNVNIPDTNGFKSFKYKANLLGTLKPTMQVEFSKMQQLLSH